MIKKKKEAMIKKIAFSSLFRCELKSFLPKDKKKQAKNERNKTIRFDTDGKAKHEVNVPMGSHEIAGL